MGLRINTNVPALVAQRNLRHTRLKLDSTLEKLASGQRINHASDDAAGLAISEGFKTQIRGMAQAERNALDGISLVQVAEGALGEISGILIRMRELSVQASSDTVGKTERGFIDIEFQQLLEEIDRIANSTQFNNVPLLNGSGGSFDVQVGIGNNPHTDRIKLFEPARTDVNVVSLGLNLATVSDKLSAQNTLDALDKSLTHINSIRAEFGAMSNRLQTTINNLVISKENVASANSRIRDADMAEETSNLTKHNISYAVWHSSAWPGE